MKKIIKKTANILAFILCCSGSVCLMGGLFYLSFINPNTTIVVRSYNRLIDPEKGIGEYGGRTFEGDSIIFQDKYCKYGIGDTISIKRKFIKTVK